MRKGFSLVEILVVLFIVAIVAAIIFPVFSRAKDQAKNTVCVSNLRQVYAAMKLYESDNDGYPFSTGASSLSPAYLSTPLYCYNPFDKRMKADYYIYGRRTETDLLGAEYNACREVRGNKFPVAADPFHGDIKSGYQTGSRFYLLIRETGNVERIPLKNFTDMMPGGTQQPPCDLRLFLVNL